ncbi:MAG: divergent polysaccharide deacetylase family protein [Alphaproteobacteria bacterium]|nr:divergent polysaccharide deacetylase family protein [Alphaproteobacteria bacterium]
MAGERPEASSDKRRLGLYAFIATATLLLLAVVGLCGWLIAAGPLAKPPPPKAVELTLALAPPVPPAASQPSTPPASTLAAPPAEERPQPSPPAPSARPPTAATPGPAASPPASTAAAAPANWLKHAQPFQAKPDRPRIALVVHDLGLDRTQTQAAIQQLPPEVTLAFSPYASGLQALVEQARAAGHEVLMQLPMEPHDYPANDPGPLALITSATTRENIERLDMVLGRADGALGVITLMGARFTASEPHMRPVLEALRQRGLVFVDARTAPDSVAARLAVELGVARAHSDRMLDQEASRAAIDARLAEVERIALANGQALALGFPFPVTLERAARWVQTLEAKNLQLAPVSAVVNRQRTGS